MLSVKRIRQTVNDFFWNEPEAADYLPPEPELDSPRATLGSVVAIGGRTGLVISEGQYYVEVAWYMWTMWGYPVLTSKRNLMARSEVEVILQ